MKNCPSCGGDITQTGQGRPSVYCSEACRRFAENQIRRLTRQLEKLEDKLDLLRFNRHEICDHLGRWPDQALQDTKLLIEEKTARLRELMGHDQ